MKLCLKFEWHCAESFKSLIFQCLLNYNEHLLLDSYVATVCHSTHLHGRH